jgi:serine/threonine protein kinase
MLHFNVNFWYVDNILIDFVNENAVVCVICDFGVSKVIGDTRSIVRGFEQPDILGFTVRYAAPEVNHLHISGLRSRQVLDSIIIYVCLYT